MPRIKIDDIAPIPFSAHFPEDQHTELTPEQMKTLRGGSSELSKLPPPGDFCGTPAQAPYPWPDMSQFPLLDPSKFPWSGEVPSGPAGPSGPMESDPR